MKKKIIIICSIILVILAIFIYKVSAYFTTECTVEGCLNVFVCDRTCVRVGKELQFSSKKNQEITLNSINEGDGIVYVRIKVFNPSGLNVDYVLEDNWSKGDDGYLYYNKPLESEDTTTDIKVKLNASNINEGTSFNLIAISESIIATFNEDGSCKPKWTNTLDMGENYDEE